MLKIAAAHPPDLVVVHRRLQRSADTGRGGSLVIVGRREVDLADRVVTRDDGVEVRLAPLK